MEIGEIIACPNFFIEKLPNDQTEQFSLTRGAYDGVASLGEIFWYPRLARYVFRTSKNGFVWNTELQLLGKFIDNLEDPRNSKETKMPDPEFTPVNTTHSDAVEISVIDQKAVDKLIAQIRPELALAVRDLIGDIQETIARIIELGKIV